MSQRSSGRAPACYYVNNYLLKFNYAIDCGLYLRSIIINNNINLDLLVHIYLLLHRQQFQPFQVNLTGTLQKNLSKNLLMEN